MSTPEQMIASRLRELAKAVVNMPESRNEFSMRVPAEPDRDADLVLARAAEMLEDMTALHAQKDARIAELERKTSVSMGVGSGDGNLFVHGDYESIKAAQAKILELDRLRAYITQARDEAYDDYRNDRSGYREGYSDAMDTVAGVIIGGQEVKGARFRNGNPHIGFAGRRTGRNDPSIPTDAGVPLRIPDLEADEQFDAECGGTIERIDIIGANGPTGDHYRAIGQPSKGDA